MFRWALIFAGFVCAGVGPAQAQVISRDEARSAVEGVRTIIAERYVFEDKRALIAARIDEATRSGRYDVVDARELSNRVTDDLQQVSNDKHLGLSWNPQRHRELSAPPAMANPAADAQSLREEVRLANHGLTEMRILPGNVRYLRITDFHWESDVTGEVYDAAIRFLRDSDAVIIDLRDNGGGSDSAVRYLISHFMPGDEQLLLSSTDFDGRPYQSRALSYLPNGRIKAPLYVLTNALSVSAAEEFIYHVKHFKLGQIVGSRTRGAANNNGFFPVGQSFIASISLFSPKHGVTGTNWEGTGIEPDIDVEPERALETAHVAALEHLAKTGSEAGRRHSSWALLAAKARLRPVILPRPQLARYQGRFGDRVVRIEGDQLMYRREGAFAAALEPLGSDLFAIAGRPEARVCFQMQRGTPAGITVLYEDGSQARVPAGAGTPAS